MTQANNPLLEQLQPWPFNGYAPGTYQSRCLKCAKLFDGDKRATTCLECAVLRAKEQATDLARLRVAVPPEPTEAMIEAGEQVLERADEDMHNYVSGITPDWDYGMEASAVYRAMYDAALSAPIIGGEEGVGVIVLRDMDPPSGAFEWLNAIGLECAPPHREITTPREDVEAALLWHNHKLTAAVFNVRDQMNFSVQLRIDLRRRFALPAPTRHTDQEVRAALTAVRAGAEELFRFDAEAGEVCNIATDMLSAFGELDGATAFLSGMLAAQSEAIDDAVATIAAVRATALSGEWSESGEHFYKICGDTLIRIRARQALTSNDPGKE